MHSNPCRDGNGNGVRFRLGFSTCVILVHRGWRRQNISTKYQELVDSYAPPSTLERILLLRCREEQHTGQSELEGHKEGIKLALTRNVYLLDLYLLDLVSEPAACRPSHGFGAIAIGTSIPCVSVHPGDLLMGEGGGRGKSLEQWRLRI